MIYLGIGSNIGDRLKNIHNAYEYLIYLGDIKLKSAVYESKALLLREDSEAQPDYLNSVIEFETDLPPNALLFEIKAIENKMGRLNKNKWSSRIIDIDILLYNELIINTNELNIPHPEITKRAFVLKPLIDICGNRILPGIEQSVLTLLNSLDEKSIKYFADQ